MTKALLLCAGFGTRLKELTKDTPKAMLDIHGKPLLEHTIQHLRKYNINNLFINLHYHANQIKDYFGNGKDFGVQINYSYEEEPLGTAGALLKLKEEFKQEETFLVCYGDLFCTSNYRKLLDSHKTGTATIMLHKRKHSNSIVEMNQNRRITKFIERPKNNIPIQLNDPWVNSGIYCLSYQIFNYFEQDDYGKALDFPKHIFPKLLAKEELYGYPLDAYRIAIDSSERLEQLKKDIYQHS